MKLADIVFPLLCVYACLCALSFIAGHKPSGRYFPPSLVKATDFKYDLRVPRNSPKMTILKFFSEKGAWPDSSDPLNCWVLNANCSNTVKGTDFKFDVQGHMRVCT